MKMIKCINKRKLIVIKSYSKYEDAFDANLNVIIHNAIKALEVSQNTYLLFTKLNTKYLITNCKK